MPRTRRLGTGPLGCDAAGLGGVDGCGCCGVAAAIGGQCRWRIVASSPRRQKLSKQKYLEAPADPEKRWDAARYRSWLLGSVRKQPEAYGESLDVYRSEVGLYYCVLRAVSLHARLVQWHWRLCGFRGWPSRRWRPEGRFFSARAAEKFAVLADPVLGECQKES